MSLQLKFPTIYIYILRREIQNSIKGCVRLVEHGTANTGPSGDLIASRTFYISRSSVGSAKQKCNGTKPVCLQVHSELNLKSYCTHFVYCPVKLCCSAYMNQTNVIDVIKLELTQMYLI